MNPKLAELVRRIHHRTQNGALVWEEGLSKDVFQVSFPKYTVQIAREFRQEDNSGTEYIRYVIRILNEENAVIEEATDVDLAEDFLGGNENSYSVMENIYTIARRTAMGVEQALDALLATIGDVPSSPGSRRW